jgi:hypothetical protein
MDTRAVFIAARRVRLFEAARSYCSRQFHGIRFDRRHAPILAFVVSLSIVRFAMLFHSVPGILPDTPMYVRLPGLDDLAQVSFLGNMPRSWVVTLPYGVLGEPNRIVAYQAAFSSFAWGVLLLVVSQARILGSKLRWTTIGLLWLLSLSSLGTNWESYVQSDSIALAGTVLVVAGFCHALFFPNRALITSALLVVGGVTAGSIRIAVFPLVVFAFMVVLIQLWRFEGNKIRVILVGLVLLVFSSYLVVFQERSDKAWGAYFAQNAAVNGRTLQQVGVIGMFPRGAELTADILREGKYKCLQKEFSNGYPWWNTLVHECPTEAVSFSNVYLGSYGRRLLTSPAATFNYLRSPFVEAFLPVRFTVSTIRLNFLSDVVDIGQLRIQLAAMGFFLIALLVTFRERGMRLWRSLALLLVGVVMAYGGVAVTVALCPSETGRVASSPVGAATILLVIASIVGACLVYNVYRQRISPRYSNG